jgi:hypothetical protein
MSKLVIRSSEPPTIACKLREMGNRFFGWRVSNMNVTVSWYFPTSVCLKTTTSVRGVVDVMILLLGIDIEKLNKK